MLCRQSSGDDASSYTSPANITVARYMTSCTLAHLPKEPSASNINAEYTEYVTGRTSGTVGFDFRQEMLLPHCFQTGGNGLQITPWEYGVAL